jgi:hypothetical protein
LFPPIIIYVLPVVVVCDIGCYPGASSPISPSERESERVASRLGGIREDFFGSKP